MSNIVITSVEEFGEAVKLAFQVHEMMLDEPELFPDREMKPILGLGKPGIGKTASIKAIAKELGIGYKEIRLAAMSEVDLIGLPIIEDGQSTFSSSALLPKVGKDPEKGIVVFDEITSCSRNLRAAALQLFDSQRSLGNYKLPDRWLCVALGNGENDGGIYNGMEDAVSNRFLMHEVVEDFEGWKRYALKANIHPAIIAFVNFNTKYLHDLDDGGGSIKVGPTPRSLSAASNYLRCLEKVTLKSGTALLENDCRLETSIKACIGDKAGGEFLAFYNYTKYLVDPKEVFAGRAEPRLKNNDMQMFHLTVQTLVRAFKDLLKGVDTSKNCVNVPDSIFKQFVNGCKWIYNISKNEHMEVATMIFREVSSECREFRQLMQTDRFDDEVPEFDELLMRYSKANTRQEFD